MKNALRLGDSEKVSIIAASPVQQLGEQVEKEVNSHLNIGDWPPKGFDSLKLARGDCFPGGS